MILDNILEFIGDTPIIKLPQNPDCERANIFVKLEEFNPGGSIKARVSYNMIIHAENEGRLKPFSEQTIIEPTGGNTGIGLAIAGAARGYKVILVIPDNYTYEKIRVLRAYGATVILSDHTTGNDSHIIKTKEILEQNPDYIWLDQLKNKANPLAHYAGTGDEIVRDFSSKKMCISAFVAGMGSGGSVSGIGKKIKESYPECLIHLVQPNGYDVFNNQFVSHSIQGWGIGMVPPIFTKEIIDESINVTYEEAIMHQRMLAKEYGLLVGISSGGNIAAAMKLSKHMNSDENIVTIAPDGGISYLDIFEQEES